MARRKETAQPSNACGFADLLLQVVHQIGLRRFYGGAETEEERGEQAKEKGYAKHGRAWVKIGDEREVERAEHPTERLEHEPVAPDAERESDDAAGHREQQSFAQQLPHDPPARRADCDPDRDLFRARRSASEEHVGES